MFAVLTTGNAGWKNVYNHAPVLTDGELVFLLISVAAVLLWLFKKR